MKITTVYDKKRGCGWRRQGYYIMGEQFQFQECDLMPIPLDAPCPCCGNGIIAQKVQKDGSVTYQLPRNLHRINVRLLAEPIFSKCDTAMCHTCPFKKIEWAYLIGVGEKFYKNKADFVREAVEQGISKRIPQLPLDFKVGETWVALAHPRGVLRHGGMTGEPIYQEEEPEDLPLMVVEDSGALVPNPVHYAPAIFGIFRPNRIEYVVGGDESDEYLERLEKRGITLVKVEHVTDEQLDLFEEDEE